MRLKALSYQHFYVKKQFTKTDGLIGPRIGSKKGYL